MKAKEIIYNIKTKKIEIIEKDTPTVISTPMDEGLNIKDAVKLVKYAKLHGWI